MSVEARGGLGEGEPVAVCEHSYRLQREERLRESTGERVRAAVGEEEGEPRMEMEKVPGVGFVLMGMKKEQMGLST